MDRNGEARRRALWLATLALGTRHAAAADEVLRYGGDAAFAPFESLDAAGRPTGFQVELLRELGPLVGARIELSLQPWAEAEAAFRAGRLDLVGMVDTAERRRWALFLRGHAAKALAIYRRRDHAEPQGLQDLAGQRVAILSTEATRAAVDTWLSKLDGPFLPFDDAAAALAALREGRADLALLPRAFADPALAAAGGGELVASRLNLALQTYALAVAPGRDDLRDRLQAGLDTLERNGRLEALRVRWLNTHRDLAEQQRLHGGLARQREWIGWLAGGSAVALAVLGAGLRQRHRRVAVEKQRRRVAEDALRRAEELLARTFAQNAEPMLLVERASGVVRDANAALLALLGVPAQAVIGQPLDAQGRHVQADALSQLVQSLDSDGALDAVPLRLTRADGQLRDCLVSADRLPVGGEVQVFCILRDITDQLAADDALRAGYDSLAAELAQARRDLAQSRQGQAQAEGALDEFTRTVSHDLKAPLNAVQGLTGLLRQRLLAGHVQEAVACSEQIERAAGRMGAMIAALASLAQVSRQPLKRRAVDMHRLASDTWTLLTAQQPERQVACRIAELPMTHADLDLVAQVWQNLLGNAWKYSGRVAEAKVSVDSYRDARGTWFRVTDNGAGFDMSRAKLLFQPFQRMHAARDFEGSGVGLSLVKRIVDHHGGEIRLRSAPGAGTVAEFTLDPLPAG